MSTTHPTPTYVAPERDLGAPLDALLVDAAALTTLHRWLPSRETKAFTASLVRRPRQVADTAAGLAAELVRVAIGSSSLQASTRDRRYAEPAWRDNPLLKRSLQAHLAVSEAVQRLVDVAELSDADRGRLLFLVDNLLDALAPSNNPLLNPAALKGAVDSGGINFVRGLRNLVSDLSQAPRVPSMVDPTAYTVGEDVAATPGVVVLRTPVFELIQYTPTTPDVRRTPLLLVPPTINKFYVLDLAPERSLIEHLVAEGQQVLAISWRNPNARHADWGIDTYIHAVLDALDATREITESDQAHLFGACSGGIVASLVSAYLAGTGRQQELAGLTLAVTVLDQANAGLTGSLLDRKRADVALARSARKGYLDGTALAEVFAWMRPNDLVWNYWVNNYLLGKTPPAFDILYWNSDTTRMPASLHRDFLEIALANKLVTPGEATAMGVPVDLGKVCVDSYVIGAVADHITPWTSCYRSSQLLGGSTRFVLSTSGHIAALVNPTSNTKASFQVNDDHPTDPKAFQAGATTCAGSWWADYATWLGDRSNGTTSAPAVPGRGRFEPITAAPGTYVLDQ